MYIVSLLLGAALDLGDLVIARDAPHDHDLLEAVLAVVMALEGSRGLDVLGIVVAQVEEVRLHLLVGLELARRHHDCVARRSRRRGAGNAADQVLRLAALHRGGYALRGRLHRHHTWREHLRGAACDSWRPHVRVCVIRSSRIASACASWGHIVLHELLLELLLLLSLASELSLFFAFLDALLLLLLVKVDRGPLSAQLIRHTSRSRRRQASVELFDYDLRHVLSEGRSLLVGVGRAVAAAARIVVRASCRARESLRGVQDLAQTLLHRLHNVTQLLCRGTNGCLQTTVYNHRGGTHWCARGAQVARRLLLLAGLLLYVLARVF